MAEEKHERNEKMYAAWESGDSAAVIAYRFGLHTATVREKLAKVFRREETGAPFIVCSGRTFHWQRRLCTTRVRLAPGEVQSKRHAGEAWAFPLDYGEQDESRSVYIVPDAVYEYMAENNMLGFGTADRRTWVAFDPLTGAMFQPQNGRHGDARRVGA